jgi:hypothetical protein
MPDKPAKIKEQPRRQVISATRKKKKKEYITFVPALATNMVVDLQQEHPIRLAQVPKGHTQKMIEHPPKLLQTRQSIESQFETKSSDPLFQKSELDLHLPTLK